MGSHTHSLKSRPDRFQAEPLLLHDAGSGTSAYWHAGLEKLGQLMQVKKQGRGRGQVRGARRGMHAEGQGKRQAESVNEGCTSSPKYVSGPYWNLMPGKEQVSLRPQGIQEMVLPSSKR